MVSDNSVAFPPAPTRVGMTAVLSPSQVDALDAPAVGTRSDEFDTQLAAFIERCFTAASAARMDVERRILAGRRTVVGEYDPAILKAIQDFGGSVAFLNMTKAKTIGASSIIKAAVLDNQEPPFHVDPTPIPSLSEDDLSAAADDAAKVAGVAAQQGQPMTSQQIGELGGKSYDMKLEQLRKEAALCAGRMHDVVLDEVTEDKWFDSLSDVITDVLETPAGVFKGPTVLMRKNRTLKKNADGKKELVVVETPKLHGYRLDPLDAYPSPHMTEPNDGGYIIERHRWFRKDLADFLKPDGTAIEGYKADAIRKVLEEFGAAGYKRGDVSGSDQTRRDAEGRGPADSNIISGADVTIDGLELWGSVQGKLLREWGMSDAEAPDENAEYEVRALMAARTVIGVILNPDPLGRKPYHFSSWERVGGTVWGRSLVECCDAVQGIMNAQIRAYVNNIAYASRPIMWGDMDKLDPAFNPVTGITPGAFLPLRGIIGGQLPVGYLLVQNWADRLIPGFKFLQDTLDDLTGVPRYAYGNEQAGGAGRTLGGLTLLMGQQGKRMRDVTMHLDAKIITPYIEMMVDWLNQYHPDDNIKGDATVVPHGSIALIMAEQQAERTKDILVTSANPIDAQIFQLRGRTKLWRELLKRLHMPTDVVPTDADLDQKEADMRKQQQAQQQAAMAKQHADIQAQAASAQADSAKARQTAVETQPPGSLPDTAAPGGDMSAGAAPPGMGS